MKNTKHFICKVQDSLNDYRTIVNIWIDTNTNKQAEKYFLSHKDIKKYKNNLRYQIIYTQNSTVLQYPENEI